MEDMQNVGESAGLDEILVDHQGVPLAPDDRKIAEALLVGMAKVIYEARVRECERLLGREFSEIMPFEGLLDYQQKTWYRVAASALAFISAATNS